MNDAARGCSLFFRLLRRLRGAAQCRDQRLVAIVVVGAELDCAVFARDRGSIDHVQRYAEIRQNRLFKNRRFRFQINAFPVVHGRRNKIGSMKPRPFATKKTATPITTTCRCLHLATKQGPLKPTSIHPARTVPPRGCCETKAPSRHRERRPAALKQHSTRVTVANNGFGPRSITLSHHMIGA